MKIYLADTGPCNEVPRERGMLDIPRRLLSYFWIIHKEMQSDQVFNTIGNEKRRQEDATHHTVKKESNRRKTSTDGCSNSSYRKRYKG